MKLLMVEDFQPHVGTVFMGKISEGEVPFMLVEARALRDSAAPFEARIPFSLLFRNEAVLLFPQQTYTVQHPEMGDMAIFMVPIARESAGFLYQAVFN